MVYWEWTRQKVGPDVIVDAANAIPLRGDVALARLTEHWLEPDRYLGWANAALGRGGGEGWDTAAGLAKRAVCRRMDGILVHNHLGHFLGQNNMRKADYLAALKVPGLSLVRDLVINPRNDIEHQYAQATEDHARRACELAELFLRATDTEATTAAVISLGWNLNYRALISTVPEQEREFYEYSVKHHHSPMLLVDVFAPIPAVLVIYPKDEAFSMCPLSEFSSGQALALNGRLREALRAPNLAQMLYDPARLKLVVDQLRLFHPVR